MPNTETTCRTFDATVDFDVPGLLELEISSHLDGVDLRVSTFCAVVRAENEDGLGQLYIDDERLPADLGEHDWVCVGRSVSEVAVELRRRLAE